MHRAHDQKPGGLGAVAVLAVLLTTLVAGPVAAAPSATPDDLTITGQVVYGSATGARKAAIVDIVQVYNNNPAYMRLKSLGLSETEGRGKLLFGEARASTNKALAGVARMHGVDVITVPGGVEGGDHVISDVTREVIDRLPIFSIEGKLLHGNSRGAKGIAQLRSQTVLDSIPAYLEWKSLNENDARYHILRKSYSDQFTRALRKVARDQRLDGLAEKGSVTSRLGPVPDVTRAAVEALSE